MDELRLLFVEDNAAHSRLVQRAFSGKQWQLDVVGSLAEAREWCRQREPAVMIADLLLPDGYGTDLLPDAGRSQTYPIVILTSHGSEELAVHALKAGAVDYLVKSDSLLASLPEVCERIHREWQARIRIRELDEARQRFAAVLEQTTDFVVMADECGRVFYLNAASRTLFGLTPESDLDTFDFWMSQSTEADTILRKEAIPTAIKSGSWTGEIRWTDHRADRELDVSVVVLVHDNLNNQPRFISLVARDLTEQKRAAEAAELRQHACEQLEVLSPRERQVMSLVVEGKANKVIAPELNLSPKTVEKHRSRVMRKLGVRSVAELVKVAIQAHGLTR